MAHEGGVAEEDERRNRGHERQQDGEGPCEHPRGEEVAADRVSGVQDREENVVRPHLQRMQAHPFLDRLRKQEDQTEERPARRRIGFDPAGEVARIADRVESVVVLDIDQNGRRSQPEKEGSEDDRFREGEPAVGRWLEHARQPSRSGARPPAPLLEK